MKSLLNAAVLPASLMFVFGCSAMPVYGQGLSSWMTVATSTYTSPVSSQVISGDLTKTWTGVDGNTIEAVVLAPRPSSSTTINLSPVAGDNVPQISSALSTLEQAGGGQLNLAAGVYDINNISDSTPQFNLTGLHDITISGTGATLMMMQWGTGININHSQRLHLIGMTIRYAAPAIVTGSIVSNGSGIALYIDPSLVPITASLTIYQVTTLNATGAGYSISSSSNRLLLGTSGAAFTSIGSGNYTSSHLTGFSAGDKVAVKLTYYLGAATVVNDSGTGTVSSDITLDHLTIANSPGMGIVVDRMGRGLAIESCNLGPVTQADGTTSIAYDGIHVSGAAGDILLLSNTINGTGDDGINLASQVMVANGAGATPGTVQIANASGITTGEMISLFDSQLNYIGTGQESSRTATVNGYSTVSFVSPVTNSQNSAFAREGALLGSRYAVSGNTVENCDCHGLLAQLPNGLVSSNTFTGLRYNAIRLITSGAWDEGTGAINVVVLSNTISNTGADTKRGFVWAAITAYGEIASTGSLTQMTPSAVNGNLKIYTNTVSQTQDACLSIGDTMTATLKTNTCTNTMLGGAPTTGPVNGSFASYSGSDAMRAAGIYIDPNTTSSITVTQ